jgi:carbon-monoxide dehydrogenase medium subunit
MDAELTIEGPGGTRTAMLDDFLLGAYTTDLAGDEILTSITLGSHGPAQAYEKFEHPASHLPLAGVCATVTGKGEVTVTVTGVAARPYRVPAATVAEPPDDLTVLDDQHASADFRLHLAAVLARRATTRALERAA